MGERLGLSIVIVMHKQKRKDTPNQWSILPHYS